MALPIDPFTYYVKNPVNKKVNNFVKDNQIFNTADGKPKTGTAMMNGMAPLLTQGFMGLGSLVMNNIQQGQAQASAEWQKFSSEMENSKQMANTGDVFGPLADGGQIPQPARVQAEKGEVIITPKFDIFDVKADKLHKDMKKKDITDILGPDDYMFSDRTTVTKKKAEKIIVGIKPLFYTEEKDKSKYEELKLSDIFQKNEHTIAELAKIVRDKYKVVEKPKTPFEKLSSDSNRMSRGAYLQILAALNEEKVKKEPSIMREEEIPLMARGGFAPKIMYEDDFFPQIMGDGGKQRRKDRREARKAEKIAAERRKAKMEKGVNIQMPKVLPQNSRVLPLPNKEPISPLPAYTPPPVPDPNAVTPLPPLPIKAAPPVKSITPEADPMYKDLINRYKEDLNNLPARSKELKNEYKNAYNINQAGNIFGSALGMFGTIAQNPIEQTPTIDMPKLPREVDRSIYDYQAWQNNKALNTMSNAAFDNTSNYGVAMNYANSGMAKLTDANSNLAANLGNVNQQMEGQYQQALSATKSQQSALNAQTANNQNKSLNDGIAQLTGFSINGINQGMGLKNKYLENLQKIDMEEEQRRNSIRNSIMSAMLMAKGYVGAADPYSKNSAATGTGAGTTTPR